MTKRRLYPAVRFRRKVYVGDPRHQDALALVFVGMTDTLRWRVKERIRDGKEGIAFGWSQRDGSKFETDDYQKARMTMYGLD